MGPFPCKKCNKCGSDLSLGPDWHREPSPHEFVSQPVETNEGTAYLDRCRWCCATRRQIEEEDRVDKDQPSE